eukprot:ANDGO_07519.mRNA.1 hypothetical protein
MAQLIQVFYGENKDIRCNADCRVDILFEYLRRKTEYFEYEVENLDLADRASGAASKLNIAEKMQDFASKHVESWKQYVLCAVERDAHTGAPLSYKALYKDETGTSPAVSDAPPPKKDAKKK